LKKEISVTNIRATLIIALIAYAPIANADDKIDEIPKLLQIPAGEFIQGSDKAEREYGYGLDEKSYGHNRTRIGGWYENEIPRRTIFEPSFSITENLVTNNQYAAFIRETAHVAPYVTAETWHSYGLVHPFERTQKFFWEKGSLPAGREDHPVVLISQTDAKAYANWLSKRTGNQWLLPTERQWEKAARGVDGRYFPWGNGFDAMKLNNHDAGPFDTTPVGGFPNGKSPYGMMDAAGQVFEWTRELASNDRVIVKGGSWDDKGCGVCRAAARHSRPAALKHILIGFRLVREE